MSVWDLLFRGDLVSSSVAVTLLAMSVASWVVILWKAWLLSRALRDVARSTGAFWQAPSFDEGLRNLRHFDREALVSPLVEATQTPTAGTLAGAGDKSQQLTRLLREALHGVLLKLQAGQVLLATWVRRRRLSVCWEPYGVFTMPWLAFRVLVRSELTKWPARWESPSS